MKSLPRRNYSGNIITSNYVGEYPLFWNSVLNQTERPKKEIEK